MRRCVGDAELQRRARVECRDRLFEHRACAGAVARLRSGSRARRDSSSVRLPLEPSRSSGERSGRRCFAPGGLFLLGFHLTWIRNREPSSSYGTSAHGAECSARAEPIMRIHDMLLSGGYAARGHAGGLPDVLAMASAAVHVAVSDRGERTDAGVSRRRRRRRRTGCRRPKIVVLGDSLTAGSGLLETQSYPALLQEKIDADGLRVRGRERRRVRRHVGRRPPPARLGRCRTTCRVLVVALGANDGLRGLSVAEMKQNLAQIIETRAARRAVLVILAGMEAPPNYGAEYAASFRQAYRDLAQRLPVPFVPFLLDKVAGQCRR